MFNLGNRTFGVELETLSPMHGSQLARELQARGLDVSWEGYHHVTMPRWKIVTDASVGGAGFHGLEVVSPILRGEEGFAELTRMCEALQAVGCTINRTCGTHVHFGANDLGTAEIRKLVKHYARYEEGFDALQPRSRRADARYCMSLVCSSEDRATRQHAMNALFDQLDACNSVEAMQRVIRHGTRFVKVNLASYVRHGTIEVRHHAGTLDPVKLGNWIRLIGATIEAARARRAPAKVKADYLTWKRADILACVLAVTSDPAVKAYFRGRARALAA